MHLYEKNDKESWTIQVISTLILPEKKKMKSKSGWDDQIKK